MLLHEVTVWRNGVVWFEDYGLQCLGFDGRSTRVKGVAAWYGRLTYAPDRIFFAKGTEVRTVSADDLSPRTILDAADLVDVPEGATKVHATVVGTLGGDVPVWQLRYRTAGDRVRTPYQTVPSPSNPTANPFFDPRNSFPKPSELTWDNVVVRCSFAGGCERTAPGGRARSIRDDREHLPVPALRHGPAGPRAGQ